jgi:bifunctional oligoribonuclease and PAP phosphatase NrnA
MTDERYKTDNDKFSQLLDLISNNKINKIIFYLHQNADPDSLCAAISLAYFFKRFNVDIEALFLTDGINTTAKSSFDFFLSKDKGHLTYEFTSKYDQSDNSKYRNLSESYDLQCLIDCNSSSQIGAFQNSFSPNLQSLIVDHHIIDNKLEGSVYLINETLGSTCAIVSELFQNYNIVPESIVASLLLIGHIYDSRRFLYGNPKKVFSLTNFLVSSGADYKLAIDLLQVKISESEKIARLKAMKRLDYVNVDGLTIGFTHIKSYESSVCRSLIHLGVDVALAVACKKSETRASARLASSDIMINLNEIMKTIAELNGGHGGGHKEAAGLNIPKEIAYDEIKKSFLHLLEVNHSKNQSSGS